MNSTLLEKSVKVLLLIYLSFVLLFYGKSFLVPFLIASLLAMLVLPLCARMERRMNKVLAVSISLFLLLAIISLVIYILAWQITDISGKASEIQKNLTEKVHQIREFATNTLGISQQQQAKIIEQQEQTSASKISGMMTSFVASFGGFLTD